MMNREYHKWFSPHLSREMELLVFGHAGARVLVFPTRTGRFFDYENWGLVESIRHKIENGWLQLFCVDSVDAESFYCDAKPPRERIHRHLQYEAYLRHEVIPLTRKKNSNIVMITHGCSMGAFHAVNFAFRHPEMVGKVVALSGRYDLTQEIGPFKDLFDSYYDQTIYFNTPTHFIPNLNDAKTLTLLRRMEIIFVIGDADPFYPNNRALSEQLWHKQVRHTMHVWQGRAHKARYWQQIIPLYL